MLVFLYTETLLAYSAIPKLDEHPFCDACHCLFAVPSKSGGRLFHVLPNIAQYQSEIELNTDFVLKP